MAGLLHRLNADRLVFPHQLNLFADVVLLVRLSEADLREHSFLDERILKQGIAHEWVAWDQFEAAAAMLPHKAPAYIFHVGHCGSTLLSRLISAATGTQALREPLPMRTIAFEKADGPAAFLTGKELQKRMSLFERAWSRGPSKTVVKATSICSNLMAMVDPSAAIAFVHQQPEIHLAVTLAGENTLGDLRGFAQYRYRRLQETAVDMQPLAEFSVGELAALSWLTEAIAAHSSMQQRSVTTLDFDRFLAEPAEHLAEVCRRLELRADPERIQTAITGPIMKSYSKAPEHAYGPELRNEVIADSRVRNGSEISMGMQWINRVSEGNPDVSAAVNLLSTAS